MRQLTDMAGMIAGTALLLSCVGPTSEPVRIVGSSTVFPFAAKTAEVYSDRNDVVMVVEQTGSGGGHKLFCSGDPAIKATTSSRPQKPSEAALCRENGIDDVVEIQLGLDGIVLARAVDEAPMALDSMQIFYALAKDVPASPTDCRFEPNANQVWSDVDSGLPDFRIEVHGPPPTSGTRDAFVETVMMQGARAIPCLALMEREDAETFRDRVQTLREDGHWIDAGENDDALVRTLTDTPEAIGLFGYSFLDRNRDRIAGISVDGVMPTRDNIRSGEYPIVRGLYLYLRASAAPETVGYVREFTSDTASGDDGYLQPLGLIPLVGADRADMQARLARLGRSAP